MNQPIGLVLAAVVGAGIPTAIDSVRDGVPLICHEVAIELTRAEDEGMITRDRAVQIFDNCLASQEA